MYSPLLLVVASATDWPEASTAIDPDAGEALVLLAQHAVVARVLKHHAADGRDARHAYQRGGFAAAASVRPPMVNSRRADRCSKRLTSDAAPSAVTEKMEPSSGKMARSW